MGLQPRALDLLTSCLRASRAPPPRRPHRDVPHRAWDPPEAAVRAAALLPRRLCFDVSAKDAAAPPTPSARCALSWRTRICARRARRAALVSVTTTDEGKRRMVPPELSSLSLSPLSSSCAAGRARRLPDDDGLQARRLWRSTPVCCARAAAGGQECEEDPAIDARSSRLLRPRLVAQHARIAKSAAWEHESH